MPQDLIDARFFSDNEIRKLVDEINGEFARLNIESPFKDIDVSNGKELSKETKAILNDAKELQKVIAQISVAGASVRDNLTDERAIIEVQRKTETAIKQVNLLAKSYKDVQKEVENILNTDYVVGFSVQGDDGQSIGEMGEQVGREFREGLESELNAYRGRDILNQTIFNGIDDAFSKYGADFDEIISKNLGNSKFDFHDLVVRALYSNILDSIGAGQGVATYERLNKDSINYSTKRDRVYIPDEVLDDAINKGTLRKGGYFKNKGAMTASDTVMPMVGGNIIEGQGFLEQMERIATSYARLDEIATLLNSVLGEGEVVIHNPFRNWDAGEGIGAYSSNVDLMDYLFEKGGYNELIDELKPLRANLIRAIQTAYKDPNNHSGITKITYQEVEDLIDELSGKNNDNPIYNARTGLKYVNKAINKGHFNSLIDEGGNVTGDYTDRERFGMRTGSLGNPNTRINERPVMGLTDIPNISDLGGVDPNKYGEEMVDIIGKWFYRVAPQYSDAISRWITIWGNRLPDPDIEKKDTIGELEEVTYDKMSDVSVKGGSSFVPVGQKYYRGGEFLDSYNILPEFFSIGQIMPREVYEQFMGGDYEYGESHAKLGEPYDPTKPSEVIDGTTLTAEELQSLLGDGVIIKDVSSTTGDAIKSGMADDFFGSYHDEDTNGEEVDAEEFWKQQWENFQKIGEVLGIPKILDLLSQINERIYAFQVVVASGYGELKKSIEDVDVKFEVPKDATFQVFKEGARPSFNIPNPFFDENGESIFLKMGREGFGTVNKKYGSNNPNSMWEDYGERVDVLKLLKETSSNEEIRNFAENALKEAESMKTHGFKDRIRNQDLIKGLYGGELPDMANFSFEDIIGFREEYEKLKEQWKNTSHYTRDELFKEIKKTEDALADTRAPNEGGLNLEEERKLLTKLANLYSNIGKEFLPKDELLYLELRMKAYGALASGQMPYQNYGKKLKALINAINKGEGAKARYLTSDLAKIETDLKSLGVDVSGIASKMLNYVLDSLHSASKKLVDAKGLVEENDIKRQIERLIELKEHLEEFIPINLPLNEYEEELYRLKNAPKEEPKDDLYTRAYQHSRDYKVQEDNVNAINELFGGKVLTIPDIRPLNPTLVGDVLADTQLVGKAIDDLILKRDKLIKRFELNIKYGNIKGAEKVKNDLIAIDDTIKTLFPNDTRDIRVEINDMERANGVIKDTDSNTKQATSNFTRFANNFDRATRAITGASGALTWFFSIVGSGKALNDMVTASSLRQTNQIMLSARRGQEEATKLYDKIQMLVVKLPGNDTFLTNILTMLGTMDKSLTGADLEYMGGVIADYYMGAQAKGQFNNETERELRNYLMTGQTRNLTNSIIASEIESLKGLNSVKERTIALEKALQKTGMDSIAHYDSYTNTFEEFKGRFQKSFADWGDVWLGFLQLGMKTYNTLDSLTNSLLSQATIAVGVIALGFVSLIGILGTLVGMIGNVVGGWTNLTDVLNKDIDFVKEDKFTTAIKESIQWIGVKIGVLSEQRYAEMVTGGAVDAETASEIANMSWRELNIATSLKSIAVKGRDAIMNLWESFTLFEVVNGEIVLNREKYLGIIVRLDGYVASTLSALGKMEEGVASLFESNAENIGIISKLRDIATRMWRIGVMIIETTALYGLAIAGFIADVALSPVGLTILAIVGAGLVLVTVVEQIGEAFGWWSDFGSMFEAISAGLGRIWESFWNNEKIQYAMYIINGFFENLMAFFDMSFLGGIWELLFGTGTGEEFDILSEIINVLGAIGEFIWEISSMDEIIEVLRSVGALMGWVMRQWNAFVDSSEYQELIDGFREIRVAFGEIWTEIAPVFDELGKAWAELWGDEKGAEKLKEDGNELLELFKAIAHFIRDYVVPFIKLLIPLIKATLMPLITVVKFITWIIEGVKWISDNLGMQNDKAPTNIANMDGGYNSIIEKQYQYDYAKGKDLAKRYINNNNGNSTVINNNFGEGSVQADARNMTAKDVNKMFTSAFGYNKARGVNGVVR